MDNHPVAPESRAYTVEEASQVLGISRTKCYEWVRSGVLPAICLGRLIRIPKDVLHDWMGTTAARNVEASDVRR